MALGAALALGMGLAVSAAVQAAEETVRSVRVTGEAEHRVPPDMALLSMEVVTDNIDAAAARRDADAVTAAAVGALRAHGIADPDIDSSGLSIQPQYRWLKKEQRQELVSYRVSRSIDARLLELEQLGPVLEAVSESGVNSMRPPRLGLVDEESLYQRVLEAAALNARERAGVIARSLGDQLGETLSVSAQSQDLPRPMAQERMLMAADAASAPTGNSYESGYLNYRVSLSVTFALR